MVRYSERRATSAKIRRICSQYGSEAEAYFHKQHCCETCGEDRLACLSVHHVHGKSLNQFEVLCHNCHTLLHTGEVGRLTYEQLQSCQEKIMKEAHIKRQRRNRVRELKDSGLTSMEVSRIVGLHPGTVRKIWLTKKEE
jgi:hypothetical protein